MPLNMPVINSIIKLTKDNDNIFRDSIFVCVQHLLYTSINLFDSLVYLGAKPENIFLQGKIYSNNQDVFNILSQKGLHLVDNLPQTKFGSFEENFQNDILRLWSEVIDNLKYKNVEKIFILDDGGFCLKNTPSQVIDNYTVIGVEQTSSGLIKIGKDRLAFPIIEVASSAAKQHIEAPMIAKSVEEKLVDKLPLFDSRLTCGVVGLGVIGRATAQKLIQLGHIVYTYDRYLEKNIIIPGAHRVNSIDDILTFCDYIFGCSGEDILENLNIRDVIKNDKFFISCSSQDKEFRSLLLNCSKNNADAVDPLSIEKIKLSDTVTLRILRGGFPINLDNTGYAVNPNDIQMTRGLLLAGLIQAALTVNNHHVREIPKHIMLCPLLQRYVVNAWLPFGSSYATENPVINKFLTIDWIKKNSGGKLFGLSYTSKLFNQ